MKKINKVNLILISLVFAGVINTHAGKISNGYMKSYGVATSTINGVKQEVLIATMDYGYKLHYIAYVINGSPYGDYIYNLLSNPDLLDKDVFDVEYNKKSIIITIDSKDYYEITKFMFKAK